MFYICKRGRYYILYIGCTRLQIFFSPNFSFLIAYIDCPIINIILQVIVQSEHIVQFGSKNTLIVVSCLK